MEHRKVYIAHSANSGGITQTMKEHSLGVSQFMREFALSEAFADLYEFCGLIHDMGKYSEEFQRHVAGENNIVKQSIYGAIYAKEKNFLEVALPIFGHHTELPNRNEMSNEMEEELYENEETYSSIHDTWQKATGYNINISDDDTFL